MPQTDQQNYKEIEPSIQQDESILIQISIPRNKDENFRSINVILPEKYKFYEKKFTERKEMIDKILQKHFPDEDLYDSSPFRITSNEYPTINPETGETIEDLSQPLVIESTTRTFEQPKIVKNIHSYIWKPKLEVKQNTNIKITLPPSYNSKSADEKNKKILEIKDKYLRGEELTDYILNVSILDDWPSQVEIKQANQEQENLACGETKIDQANSITWSFNEEDKLREETRKQEELEEQNFNELVNLVYENLDQNIPVKLRNNNSDIQSQSVQQEKDLLQKEQEDIKQEQKLSSYYSF